MPVNTMSAHVSLITWWFPVCLCLSEVNGSESLALQESEGPKTSKVSHPRSEHPSPRIWSSDSMSWKHAVFFSSLPYLQLAEGPAVLELTGNLQSGLLSLCVPATSRGRQRGSLHRDKNLHLTLASCESKSGSWTHHKHYS